MRITNTLLIAVLSTMAMAKQLFVGSYSGQILTLNLDESTGKLTQLSSTNASAPEPSWQELSSDGKILYTVEETASTNPNAGAVSSYSIGADGALTKISTATGLKSPVSLAISPDGKTIFTASYSTSGVSAYSTTKTGNLTHLKDWTYKLTGTPTVPTRQEAPHPHQAIFDPTGKFVVVPDLGADILRVYSITSPTTFTELPNITVKPGTGPRHGAFFPTTGKAKFYYLVGEVENCITVFSVTYPYNGGLQMKELQSLSTLPKNYTGPIHEGDPVVVTPTASGAPTTTATAAPWSTPSAAELAILPDGKTIYVSNRNDKVFENSHSIASFTRNTESGLLTEDGHFESGVKGPRHIALGGAQGEWFVTEGQESGNIKVFRRSKGGVNNVAEIAMQKGKNGGPVCVTFRN